MMKVRMLHLFEILHRQSDDSHILNGQTLVQELANRGIVADRRSIYRDIQALVEYGEDVVTTSNGFYLRNRKFSLAEIMLLISAVQAAPFITKGKTELLITKLSSFLSSYQEESLRDASNIGTVKFKNEEVYRTIEMLNYAIASNRQVSFLYYKRNITRHDVVQRHGKRYNVSPYAMTWVQDRYYLISNMDGRDGLTHFRLDRIRDVRIEDSVRRPVCEVSEYKSKFDAADYASKCVNMFGGEVTRIRLRCKVELLNEVFDRFGDDIPVKKDGEDWFVALISAAESEGLINWICQFGARIEVLSPQSLRSSLASRLREAASLYIEEV